VLGQNYFEALARALDSPPVIVAVSRFTLRFSSRDRSWTRAARGSTAGRR